LKRCGLSFGVGVLLEGNRVSSKNSKPVMAKMSELGSWNLNEKADGFNFLNKTCLWLTMVAIMVL
jgi:hypothetical protein